MASAPAEAMTRSGVPDTSTIAPMTMANGDGGAEIGLGEHEHGGQPSDQPDRAQELAERRAAQPCARGTQTPRSQARSSRARTAGS